MPPEADKIVLLPRCDAPPHLDSRTVARSLSAFEQKLEPKIAVPMPFGVGESGWVGTLVSPRPPSLNESLAISQKKFLYEVLKVFGNKFRALKISDEPGIGKKTFAAELAHFATVRPPGKGVAEALALDELAGAEVPVRGGGVARPLRRPCACAFGLAAQRQPQYSRRALAHRPCHRVAYSACPCGPPFSLVGHRHLQDPLREDEEADEPPHQRPHGLEEPCRGSQPPWPKALVMLGVRASVDTAEGPPAQQARQGLRVLGRGHGHRGVPARVLRYGARGTSMRRPQEARRPLAARLCTTAGTVSPK